MKENMDRKTAKAMRTYAKQTGEKPQDVKRQWLKLSHKQRGAVRKQLVRGR